MNHRHNFQRRVYEWAYHTFGLSIATNHQERTARFVEEAIELGQLYLSAQQVHELVDHVYSRPEGVYTQEIGGVMVTLAALCEAIAVDMDDLGERELARCWTVVEKIRAKQAEKKLRFGGNYGDV